MELAPSAYAAMGEVAYESGDVAAARTYFEKSASLWVDDLPDAASVEAKCYQGLLAALDGRTREGQTLVETGLSQARKMGRVYLEARCRTQLAHVALNDRNALRALVILNESPRVDSTVIGPELLAEQHSWRGRALAMQGQRADAAAENAAAKELLTKVRAAIPDLYRGRFDARADIRVISN